MVNRWVEFVRQWSSAHNVSYMCAVSMPEMRNAYHRSKTAPLSQQQVTSNAQSMMSKNDRIREARRLRDESVKKLVRPSPVVPRAPRPINPFKTVQVKTGVINNVSSPTMINRTPVVSKAKAGRPVKYATDEERKLKKREQTLASNKRKNLERKTGTGILYC
jgi:hypothetical protein